MQELIPLLENMPKDSQWTRDGTLFLKINRRGVVGDLRVAGVVRTGADGLEEISFCWMSPRDMRILACFLCGVTKSHLKSQGTHPAELYFKEVIRMVDSAVEGK